MIYLKKIASIRGDLPEGAHCIVWDEVPTVATKEAAALVGIGAQANGTVTYLTYPAGILDLELWDFVDAIAQQTNCICCSGAGLAKSLAEAIPYGDPYSRKRPIWLKKRFAILNGRSKPGTVSIHLPWNKAAKRAPMVINMFAQWELGPAQKYNRIPWPASYGTDSESDREIGSIFACKRFQH